MNTAEAPTLQGTPCTDECQSPTHITFFYPQILLLIILSLSMPAQYLPHSTWPCSWSVYTSSSWLNSTEQKACLIKIFYPPTAQHMPCFYQTVINEKIKVSVLEKWVAKAICSEPEIDNRNQRTIQEKYFLDNYLEASWHCWIYFQFYLLVEIWQVTSYHQQDPYGHPVCHPGWYQTGCTVNLLGSYQGPL